MRDSPHTDHWRPPPLPLDFPHLPHPHMRGRDSPASMPPMRRSPQDVRGPPHDMRGPPHDGYMRGSSPPHHRPTPHYGGGPPPIPRMDPMLPPHARSPISDRGLYRSFFTCIYRCI